MGSVRGSVHVDDKMQVVVRTMSAAESVVEVEAGSWSWGSDSTRTRFSLFSIGSGLVTVRS